MSQARRAVLHLIDVMSAQEVNCETIYQQSTRTLNAHSSAVSKLILPAPLLTATASVSGGFNIHACESAIGHQKQSKHTLNAHSSAVSRLVLPAPLLTAAASSSFLPVTATTPLSAKG